jgi:hypothetical protein
MVPGSLCSNAASAQLLDGRHPGGWWTEGRLSLLIRHKRRRNRSISGLRVTLLIDVERTSRNQSMSGVLTSDPAPRFSAEIPPLPVALVVEFGADVVGGGGQL